MPHSTEDNAKPSEDHPVLDTQAQAEADDELINTLLAPNAEFDFTNRDLDPGEKAEDAVDYEDISDDDLPEEEVATEIVPLQNGHEPEVNGVDLAADPDLFGDDLFGDNGENGENGEVNVDDLFGDALASDRMDLDGQVAGAGEGKSASARIPNPRQPSPEQTSPNAVTGEKPAFRDVDYGHREDPEEDLSPEVLEQMRLFGHSRYRVAQQLGMTVDDPIPPAPQTDEELFERIWPRFNKDEVPKFGVLLPTKRARYNGKKPLKLPKPIQPHKITLELEVDQERTFKLTAHHGQKRKREDTNDYGIVVISEQDKEQKAEDDAINFEDLDDNERVGGVTVQDLRILCEDWDNLSTTPDLEQDSSDLFGIDEETQLDAVADIPAAKRLHVSDGTYKPMPMYADDFGAFDDPEVLTAKIAKKVLLDLNDPSLLIDTLPQTSSHFMSLKARLSTRENTGNTVKKALERRYNFSNDDAYELLKENHSNKVRTTLSNLSIEHSMVAVKLQYPFYKVKLNIREARAYHRPTQAFPIGTIRLSELSRKKIKEMKGRDPQTIYQQSKDLSMSDNSHMLLVEYSEEYPTSLSNVGMGSKLINYYRRKDVDDHNRPKLDFGETHVLLPEDRSPFAIFGNVEPGALTPTFHNGMYRAPVFRHDPKQTDFLCIRSTTGIYGTMWYLRNMDNLYVAGQQFPSVEVPGTHSRKVTDAAKRRLRMISWRIWKRNRDRNARGPWLSNKMIQDHLPGSDVAQNRGKMREFMQYDKTMGSWNPKENDVVPEDDIMRGWIKPEDICLLDSMQVGDRHLQDVGYDRSGDAENEEDDEKDAEGIDQQLAPWQTTKNFINACAGKAMLQLHGEGDPSGRGEAFSFIKTSMKGGFRAIGESIEDRLDAKRLKELGGHSYNVAKQQQAYEDAIKRIWDAQARSLSEKFEPSDVEPGVEDNEGENDRRAAGRTPRSEFGTPSVALSRRDDETGSQFSRLSSSSQAGRVLKIKRTVRGKGGKIEVVEEIVHDRRVIKQYMRRRTASDFAKKEIMDFVPTGNAEEDARQRKQLEAKLLLLEKNQARRKIREKAKKMATGSVPETPNSPSEAVGGGGGKFTGTTQRRCANCGQVGHIKTNKKLCPLLNGSQRQDQNGFDTAAFGTPIVPPSNVTSPATGFPFPGASPAP